MRALLSISLPSLTRGMSVTLTNGQEISVGASRWADLVLQDPTLSGLQFQISMLPTECWLRDLKSSTGTFVNGTRVTATEICDGDVIQSGETSITISLLSDQSPKAVTDFVPHEFRFPADLLTQCTSVLQPNGLLRLSSGHVRIRTIAIECVTFGLGILTNVQSIPPELQRAANGTSIADGLMWLTVSTDILDECLATFWGSNDSTWFVGQATEKSLTRLGNQLSQWIQPSLICQQLNEFPSTRTDSFFGQFRAMLLSDKSSVTGWSLLSRPRKDPRQSELLLNNPPRKKKGQLSSVA